MTNGAGINHSREADFEAFDKAPKAVRDFFNSTNIPLSCLQVSKLFWRYDLVEALPMIMAKTMDAELKIAIETWGADHPFVIERTKEKNT